LARAKTAISDGAFELPTVYPGRYQVSVFVRAPEYYLNSIRIGEQEVLGKDGIFASGMPALRVVYGSNAGSVRGTAAGCAGGPVIALPDEEELWNFRFIKRSACDARGRFEIVGLRPGSYTLVALDRIDGTGLDDLSTLRRLAAIGTHAQVEAGPPAIVELKRAAWPD
jgi:hypothetical protein